MIGRATPTARRAFTLLEVILALAIFMVSLAVLVQLTYLSMRNARIARDRTTAQLLCQSILSEVRAGSAPLEAVFESPVENDFDVSRSGWLYSIDVETIDEQGLLAVTVTVTRSQTAPNPVSVSLTQWMIDPEAEFFQPGEDLIGRR